MKEKETVRKGQTEKKKDRESGERRDMFLPSLIVN